MVEGSFASLQMAIFSTFEYMTLVDIPRVSSLLDRLLEQDEEDEVAPYWLKVDTYIHHQAWRASRIPASVFPFWYSNEKSGQGLHLQ